MEKRKTNWFVIFVVFIMGVAFVISGVQTGIIALVILGAIELLIAFAGIFVGIKGLRGSSIPKEKLCPNCGAPIDGETVCKNCGLGL